MICRLVSSADGVCEFMNDDFRIESNTEVNEIQIPGDQGRGTEVGLESEDVGENIGQLAVSEAKPFGDHGGLLIDGGGGNPKSSIRRRGINPATHGQVRERPEDLPAFDGTPANKAVASPRMIRASRGIVLVRCESAIEIRG